MQNILPVFGVCVCALGCVFSIERKNDILDSQPQGVEGLLNFI